MRRRHDHHCARCDILIAEWCHCKTPDNYYPKTLLCEECEREKTEAQEASLRRRGAWWLSEP